MSSWNEMMVANGSEEPHRVGLFDETSPGLRPYADIGEDGLAYVDSVAQSCFRRLLRRMVMQEGDAHDVN